MMHHQIHHLITWIGFITVHVVTISILILGMDGWMDGWMGVWGRGRENKWSQIVDSLRVVDNDDVDCTSLSPYCATACVWCAVCGVRCAE